MKKKIDSIYIISRCIQCPYFTKERKGLKARAVCLRTGRMFNYKHKNKGYYFDLAMGLNEPPDWCPLDNYEGGS